MSIALCPGCKETKELDALSRYKHGSICSNCGTKEAFYGDIIRKDNAIKAGKK